VVVLPTAPRRSAVSDRLQQLTAAKPINRHPALMDPEGSPLYWQSLYERGILRRIQN
jgi:hypothetical protein